MWLAGMCAATVAGVPAYSGDGSGPSAPYSFGVILPAQQLAVLGALAVVSRAKGRGTLTKDFGLAVRRHDARGLAWGVGLQFGLTALTVPLTRLADGAERQRVLQDLDTGRGPLTYALFAVGVVVMAPLTEELLYRGLLLRSLLRRIPAPAAVLVAGLVFGLVHLIGDPDAIELVPALAALGVVLGALAVRTNSLSLPILVHAGFNLTTAVVFAGFGR